MNGRKADTMDDRTYDEETDALHIDSEDDEDSAKSTTSKRLVLPANLAILIDRSSTPLGFRWLWADNVNILSHGDGSNCGSNCFTI